MSIKVPTQIPDVPHEGARQPQFTEGTPPTIEPSRMKIITFADDSQLTQRTASQKSNSTYKDCLSQPAAGIRHRDKLVWLQRRRGEGLWVQCDRCDNWRHLPHVLDSHELPDKWFCTMNPDAAMADCSVSESGLRVRDEEDLIHSEYSAGSVVWARLGGWPWWPALVDDCPDTEQYYWLDGFSDIPTYYNVVFFDAFDVTRAWIAPDKLKPFLSNKNTLKSKDRKYKNRLEVALRQAEDALNLPIQDRLAKYSFVARFKGNINSPKKITKTDLVRYQKQLKRKFNIEFPIESESESDNENDDPTEILSTEKLKRKSNKGNKKKISVAKPKKTTTKSKITEVSVARTETLENVPIDNGDVKNNTCETVQGVDQNHMQENTESTNEIFKHPASMVVQIGSTITTQLNDNTTREIGQEDNDSSTTYVPDDVLSKSPPTQMQSEDLQVSIPSPCSDDFEF